MNMTDISPLYVIYATILLYSLASADIAQKLNAVSDKESGDKTESPVSIHSVESPFMPFLQNMTEIVGNIRDTFEKFSQTSKLNRIYRKSLSGCELIPAELQIEKPVFLYCKTEVNWHMADQHCKVHGMRLAVVDNSAAFDTVVRFLDNYIAKMNLTTHAVWIGGTDFGSEGKWYWAPTGRAITWGNWLPGQPDNWKGNERCLNIWRRPNYHKTAFNDGWCSYKFHFVCETNYIP